MEFRGRPQQPAQHCARRSPRSEQVRELEPNRRFAFVGDLGPFHGTLTYDFEDVEGATLLTNTADFEGRGLARLAGPLAANRVRDAVAANLAALKRLLESRTVPGPR